MNEALFNDLKIKIKPYFENGGSHEISHTLRVYKLAVKISEEEKADLDVIKASALLHDIARGMEDNKKINCHAEEGAKIAEKILKKTDFPKEKIKSVVHAIAVHRHSKGLKAETKEAEILQDADRLDALGAITIARMFSSGGKNEIPFYNLDNAKERTTISGFYNKIFKLKPETFKTAKAKEIAKERYAYVEEFVDRFKKEWEGKL